MHTLTNDMSFSSVTTRLDYCSTLYIGLPAVRLGCLERLPPRSLPSHPGHQRLQFTPIIGTGVTLCSFCSYIHNPGPCILGGWPLCVEWASVVAKIASQ